MLMPSPTLLQLHHYSGSYRDAPILALPLNPNAPAFHGRRRTGTSTLEPNNAAVASSDVDDNRPMRCYYQNVRGLRTKVDPFFLAASDCDYDVVVLTETWLDECLYSAQLFGNGFAVHRTDRNPLNSRKTRGGGVLIAVSTRWNSYIDPTPVSNAIEQLWVRIATPRRVVSVGVIYLPPDRRNDINSIHEHVDPIGAVFSNLDLSDYALQFGDYNQPQLRWCKSSDGSFQVDSLMVLSAASSTLIDGFALHGLMQVNGIANKNARFLDLVLSNEAATPVCTVSEAIEPLITLDADHPALDVLLNLPTPIIFESAFGNDGTPDFRRADHDGIRSAISPVDWQTINSATCIDDAVDYFQRTIVNLISEFVPDTHPPLKPPWSNNRLRRLKRLRARALRRYCRNRSHLTKQEFNRASISVQESKAILAFRKFQEKEAGLPMSVHLGEQVANSELEKCDLFVQYFRNSFNERSASPAQVAIAINDCPSDTFEFRPFHISEQIVMSALQK
ncbi:uncharacterized protein LOC128736048 [Sabethes cyaneus]|uniref:uncharacterized protein LOC128736048 n=1 Tax=Sabethes cyaneus TaxID=53552 RepID=UPI00237E939C|nr:uncharacterized protein LOC128736048 [Sabethes cyaneus]